MSDLQAAGVTKANQSPKFSARYVRTYTKARAARHFGCWAMIQAAVRRVEEYEKV